MPAVDGGVNHIKIMNCLQKYRKPQPETAIADELISAGLYFFLANIGKITLPIPAGERGTSSQQRRDRYFAQLQHSFLDVATQLRVDIHTMPPKRIVQRVEEQNE
ncbi:MAG: hypothetical protein JJT99_06865 [Rhodobacteraceae bacterium]|nr:hypothetical protein [Paracoccaceae bacterium]